jgi:hypothetical protein
MAFGGILSWRVWMESLLSASEDQPPGPPRQEGLMVARAAFGGMGGSFERQDFILLGIEV